MWRTRRFYSLVLALAMIAGAFGVGGPASAQSLTGTASVDVANILANEPGNFTFSVTQFGPTNVNWVRISPRDPELYDANGNVVGRAFTITGGSGPTGWTFRITADGEALFRGGSLANDSPAQFSVLATSGRPGIDTPRDWGVEISSDDGATGSLVNVTPKEAGSLTTTIRVLEVHSVAVTAPPGVTDGTATAGQKGLTVSTQVENRGSGLLTVTPALTSSATDDVITSPANQNIGAGNTHQFQFLVDLGSSTADRTYTGDASATGADGVSATTATPLVVQSPAIFSGANLAPIASNSGSSRTFTMQLTKSNPPTVTLNTVRLSFASSEGPAFDTVAPTPITIGPGAQSQQLVFNSVTIPGIGTMPHADYVPTLTLSGKDGNGASLSQSFNIGGFTIDNTVPAVGPTLSGPPSQKDPSGAPVVKNGDTLTFGGSIKRNSEATAVADPTAKIVYCELVRTGADGVEVIPRINVLSNCTNGGGSITGSFTPADLGVAGGSVRLAVGAVDDAGNSNCGPGFGSTTNVCAAPALSAPISVDNVTPRIDANKTATGCGPVATGAAGVGTCDDFRTVVVELTEPVKGDFGASDFRVAGNDVLAAESTCTATTFCGRVILRLATALASDDATPSVQYAFAGGVGRSQPKDGPAHPFLSPQALNAKDGIVPDLPTLTTVSQKWVDDNGIGAEESFGAQGGDKYYTNDSTPTFTLAGVGIGYIGIIALDTNGTGNYEPGLDAVVGECISEGSSVACTSADLGSAGTKALVIASKDASANLSRGRGGDLAGKNGRPVTLELDGTAPTAKTFTSGLAMIDLTLSELIPRGRNQINDWRAFRLVGQSQRRIGLSAVSGSGDTRSLRVNDTEYRADAKLVRYVYDGPPSQRYRDRAGNPLADFALQL